MGWRPKGDTPSRLPRTKGFQNRQCSTCAPPCQGGEVLHKRGHCCHSYCGCTAFTPERPPSLMGALEPRLAQKVAPPQRRR